MYNKQRIHQEVRFNRSGCSFCKQKKEPDYKDVKALEEFTTDRGKIISRSRTGVCQKHQRRLNKAIKRARFLALLPFISRV